MNCSIVTSVSSRCGEAGRCGRGLFNSPCHSVQLCICHTLNRYCNSFYAHPAPNCLFKQDGGGFFGGGLGWFPYISKALTSVRRVLGKNTIKTKALTFLHSNTENPHTCAHMPAHARRVVLECKSVKDIDNKGYWPNTRLTSVRTAPLTCLKQGLFGGVYG